MRLSLCETLGDLENKDLQLTLAMQDLFIATDEIKKAASMRLELQKLERWGEVASVSVQLPYIFA